MCTEYRATVLIRPTIGVQPPRECKQNRRDRNAFDCLEFHQCKIKSAAFDFDGPHVIRTTLARFRPADERRSLDGRERAVDAIPFLRDRWIQCRTDRPAGKSGVARRRHSGARDRARREWALHRKSKTTLADFLMATPGARFGDV